MTVYRFYQASAGGALRDVAERDCASDEEAAREALRYVNGCDVEVWREGRLIVRIPGPYDLAKD